MTGCLPSRKRIKSRATIEPAPISKLAISEPKLTSDGVTSTSTNNTTADLVRAVLPIAIPVIRTAASKRLVSEGLIIRNEEPVLEFDEHANDPSCAIIGDIDVDIKDVMIVEAAVLKEDMLAAPTFEWPEKERYEELMSVDSNGNKLLVLDLVGFNACIHLGPGIEITVPVELPMGIKCDVEIGCGGDIQDPWVRISVPKLRVWFQSGTNMLYAAFMDRPDLEPYLHVNADKGSGDFFNSTITEKSSLDDVVENVLSSFGPKFKETGALNEKQHEEKQKLDWIANLLGKKISKAIEKELGMGGNRKPLQVDLSEAIQDHKDKAMGKPRRTEYLKAKIARLEKELELAEEQEKNASRTIASAPATITEEKQSNTDAEKDTNNASKSSFFSMMPCCGSLTQVFQDDETVMTEDDRIDEETNQQVANDDRESAPSIQVTT